MSSSSTMSGHIALEGRPSIIAWTDLQFLGPSLLGVLLFLVPFGRGRPFRNQSAIGGSPADAVKPYWGPLPAISLTLSYACPWPLTLGGQV